MDETEFQIELAKQKAINKKLIDYLRKIMSIEMNIEQWPVYRKKELKKEIKEYLKTI